MENCKKNGMNNMLRSMQVNIVKISQECRKTIIENLKKDEIKTSLKISINYSSIKFHLEKL